VINFRYHVVSLAAVFLALAIGLVVGTAAANGPVADNLRDQISGVTGTNQQLRDQLNQARDELDKQEGFATETAPMVLTGKLADKRVLVVAVDGPDKDVDKCVNGVAQLLGVAGAKVTGQLRIRDKFTAPASNDTLLDLAEQAAPPSVSGALPNQSNGAETSAALLAALLVGRAGAPAMDGTRTMLTAYESQGFVATTGDFATPAEAVVVCAGAPATGKDADKKNAATTTVVSRFQQAGRLVVAGLSDKGVVEAVRGDGSLAKAISTVDNAGTAQGKVVAVLALVERLAGRTGHYGIGSGANGLVPKPAGAGNGS
jgi:Copper transport outer membrane protein, MctB